MDVATDCIVDVDGEGIFFSGVVSLNQLKQSVANYMKISVDQVKIKVLRGQTRNLIIDEQTFVNLIIQSKHSEPYLNLIAERANVMPLNFNRTFIKYRVFNRDSSFQSIDIPNYSITLKDLSDMIIAQENYKKDLICAMYTAEGNPLTGRLIQMFSTKLEKVMADEIGVFVVPNFEKIPHQKLDPSVGSCQLTIKNTETSQDFAVRVNLSKDTLLVLKQKIFNITDIPTLEQKLKYNNEYISSDNLTLNSLSIENNSVLELSLNLYEFDEDTYKECIIPSKVQTEKGRNILHHFLYNFKKNVTTFNKIATVIRYITSNCAPLLHALYELKQGKYITILDSIALEEGALILIQRILNDIYRRSVDEKKLLEFTLESFGIVLEISQKSLRNLELEEKYETISINCQISNDLIKRPVALKLKSGYMLCEYSSVEKAINQNKPIVGIDHLSQADLVVSPAFQLILARNNLEQKLNITRWTGNYKTEISAGEIVSMGFGRNIDWSTACKIKQKYPLTTLQKALTLKSNDFICLTLGKDLNVRISRGLQMKEVNKIELLNVIKHTSSYVDVNELALITDNLIESSLSDTQSQEIVRTPDEITVIVFDCSGSMNYPFFDDTQLTRLVVAQQCFDSFADRVIGFRLNMQTSVVVFNSLVRTGCAFKENVLNFTEALKNCELGNGSRLWDAINHAISELDCMQSKYPNSFRRILCLTDGRDHNSTAAPLNLAAKLQKNKVILDAVVIGKFGKTLKGLCFATGGCIFVPKTLPDAIKLFEAETFLSVRLRPAKQLPLLSTPESLVILGNSKDVDSEPPPVVSPSEIFKEVIPLTTAYYEHCQSLSDAQTNKQLYRRILQEIKFITNNKNKNVDVYLCKDDLTFWNVIIHGPENSPYSGGTFLCYVRFEELYPVKPPQLRFVTRVYHCNINSTGRVCHAILDQFYSSDTTVKRILDSVYGLFMTPEPNDPLDSNIAALFKSDPERYYLEAIAATKKYAGIPAFQLLRGIDIRVGCKTDYLDPWTGMIMASPVYCETLECNLDISTVQYIIAHPDDYPGIYINMDKVFFNDQLRNEIKEYLAQGGYVL